MCALGVVELERVGERLEDGVGDPGGIAALEALVILDAHSGERGHLFTAQARYLPTAVATQPDLVRCDLRAPAGQELRELTS